MTHLSRSFAPEGAPHSIRSNVVNPKAVIRNLKFLIADALEVTNRDRPLLTPENIAEGVYLFAAEQFSSRFTGNILNADAGTTSNLARFTR